ncbi:MAG TPA: ATP synthase F1 subunit delta [Candidatus Hydrogenedens sp.]|nr:ATP synthase F1 subunit delta [Candidatus Hydrogenedens sp.]
MNLIIKNRLAQRYAEALKSFVKDENELLRINKAYQVLSYLIKNEPQILTFLKNPAIPFEDKTKLLKKILSVTNPPDYFIELGELLIKHNRVDLITSMARLFAKKIDPWLNQIEVEVITATKLTPDSEQSLLHTLERFTGKRVRLVKHIDSHILGGLIVQFYGFSFDFSYRTQLEKLKEEIMEKEISINVT